MTKKEKVKLSILLKQNKIDSLSEMTKKYFDDEKYDKASDMCDTLNDLSKQVSELCDLLNIADEEEFNSEYDYLKKYMEI